MYEVEDIGRFQLGQDLPIWVRCRGSSHQDAQPDAAPLATIVDASGNVAAGPLSLPPVDRSRTTGLFRGKKFLGPEFAAGQYTVLVTWLVSAVSYAQEETFEILPGGHADGRIIGLYCYERPYSTHLVMHTTRGLLTSGRNPSA